jgi:hypothetical protein
MHAPTFVEIQQKLKVSVVYSVEIIGIIKSPCVQKWVLIRAMNNACIHNKQEEKKKVIKGSLQLIILACGQAGPQLLQACPKHAPTIPIFEQASAQKIRLRRSDKSITFGVSKTILQSNPSLYTFAEVSA